MIRALLLAFAQLSDPTSRRVVWIGVLSAAAAFGLLAVGVWWALFHTQLTGYAWVDQPLDVLGGLAVLILAWFLFPATVGMVSSFFLDEVLNAVERRHYPHLPPARQTGITEELVTALRFFAVVLLVNVAALPLYLMLPGLNLLVFYTANGYLLGREYFEMVAIRRLGRKEAGFLRRARPLKPFSAGVAIAFLSTIPFVNLLVPVIASAFMVHVYHSMTGHAAARSSVAGAAGSSRP
ncbi:EI24 domain-containing protein [Azospirillum sp. sgz302134]